MTDVIRYSVLTVTGVCAFGLALLWIHTRNTRSEVPPVHEPSEDDDPWAVHVAALQDELRRRSDDEGRVA